MPVRYASVPTEGPYELKAKIVIVGGGVIGTSIALKLARHTDPLEEPVVLLERGELASGSSGRSGAILRSHYFDPTVAAMARDSLQEYRGFEARTGRTIGFLRTGVLTLAGPAHPEWIERVRGNVEMLTTIGVDTWIVEAKQISELLPGIRVEAGTIGAWEPQGGFVDPLKTVEAFASLARTYGAVTRVGVGVEEILVEGGRLRGVRSSEGDYEAEIAVLCAGPWSGSLLERIGIRLPLRVIRPENHFLGLPGSYRESMVEEEGGHVDLEDPLDDLTEQLRGAEGTVSTGCHPVLIDLETQCYARCEPGERRTRVGRTDYDHDDILEDPDDLVDEISEETQRWAREQLVKRVPVYEKEADVGSQAAWYTLTPDAQAMLGPVPGVEGLYIAAGFSGHGFKLAPAVGEGMTQMILGEKVSAFDPAFFSPIRFDDDPVWKGRFGL